MVKPSRKLKKTLLILGVTGAVYLSFRYLLPLVIPFLLAYIFALALRPAALWIRRKCRFIPLVFIGTIEIVFALFLFCILLYVGGKKLFLEGCLLLENLPRILGNLDRWLMENCSWAERLLKLPDGYMVKVTREIISGGIQVIKGKAMAFLMVNTMTIVKCLVSVVVFTVIFLIATILTLQEMEDIRRRKNNSIFRNEYALLGNRMMTAGSAWLKTQGIIMLLTASICSLGLFFMGNPYFILLGIGIGLLDALPFFGTGTVFIPWTLFSLINRHWGQAAGLLFIYVVCYFLREIMEAKIMGNKVGLTPLETMISMYVGLELFGLFGFILGPMGLLIIEDIVELYGEWCYNESRWD